MAGKTAILAIRIISDATKAAKGFRQAETGTQKFERRLGSASKVALGAIGVIGALGAKARSEASELQQSAGAVQAVFGKQAKAIKKASKSAADDLGLAKSAYQNMAAVLGAQLGNMGVAQDKLVPQTKNLIKLGGDLAATYGGTTSDAVEALSSLMRGERDPIEKYGVSIKQADINAQLAAKGQLKLTGAARKQAETEATLALLTKQTAKAQGQRAREAGTDAQAAERATAKMKNAYASLGRVILPITAGIANGLADVLGWVEKNRNAALAIIGTIAALSAAVLVVNGAYKAYKAVLAAAQVVQAAFNLVMSANPVVLVVLAVVALAAALVVAYKKSDKFRAIVQTVGRAASAAIGWIVDKAKDAGTWLGKLGPAASKAKDIAIKAFELYTAPIRGVINLVKDLVGWIKKIKFPSIPKGISKLAGAIGLGGPGPGVPPPHSPGGSVPAGGRGGPSGGGFGVPVGAGRDGYGNTYITISGALDPNAVAKQIEKLLRARNVRIGTA